MTASGLLATVLFAAAAALVIPPPPGRLLARRGVGRGNGRQPSGSRPRYASGRQLPRTGGHRPAASAGRRRPTDTDHSVDGPSGVLAAVRVRPRSRARVASRRAAVIELCTAMAAELRAGSMPVEALDTVTRAIPGVCDEAAREALLGGDTVSALRTASARPGGEGLSRLAAAWAVTELAGSGLADGCERVATWLREEESLRREVAAQLAGPRASARLLTLLPVVGLALGAGIGGDPLGFLLGSPYGLGCLVGGASLVLTGLWWTERLARSVEARI